MTNKLVILIAIISILLTANTDNLREQLEKKIRLFLTAIENRDEKLIKQLCTYDVDLPLLWNSKVISKDKQNIQKIKKAPIEWLKPNETLRLPSGNVKITPIMVNKDRKIALIKIPRYAGPIQIVNINDQWKILPYWFLLNEKIRIEKKLISETSTHLIEIDGQSYNINVDEHKKIKLSDGREVNITLKDNPKRRINWGMISFIYPSNYRVKKFKYDESYSIVLKSPSENRIAIETSKYNIQNPKLILENNINSYIKSYQQQKIKILKQETISSLLIGQKVQGQRIFSKLSSNTIKIDTFFCFIYKSLLVSLSYHCYLENINTINQDIKTLNRTFELRK